MISFGLYLLSFLANTLVVLTAPAHLLKGYVLIYNVASVIYSLALFAYFTKLVTVRRSIVLAAAFALTIAVVGITVGWYEACILAYPGLLILSDYLVTQSHGLRVVSAFRLLMIVSAAPFIISPAHFATNLGIRVALLVALTVGLALTAKESHRLAVKSPVRFQIGNYLFYNGTLSLMAVVIHQPTALRWWYLATQIGLVLVLKVLDYSLRRAYSLDRRTRLLAFGAAGVIPVAVMPFYPNILAISLFLVGFVGLMMTSRYITK